MRYLLLLLLTPLAVVAQSTNFPEPVSCRLVPKATPASVYIALKDTAKGKPWSTVNRSEEVSVVGMPLPGWALIKRNTVDGKFFIRKSELAGFATGLTIEQITAKRNEPLPIDPSTHLITYSQVVEVPGVSQNELYARGKVWFANTFNSAQNVVQADDKEAGVLVGKGWQATYVRVMGMPLAQKLWFTVRVSFKDGRYRYEFTSFLFENEPSQGNINPTPMAAEFLTTQATRKGELTPYSRNYRNSLAAAVEGNQASIIASMTRPAAGGDW